MDKGCEEVVAEVVGVCPWMTEEDVGLVRLVISSHLRLVTGEVVDMGAMAGALLGLAQRAEEVGDVRRAWVFDQLYSWVCASMRGEEYHWPELPQELAVLP